MGSGAQRSARRSDAPEPDRHIAMKTSTAMSSPVCGRLELLDEPLDELDELGELDGELEAVPGLVPPELPLDPPLPELPDASTVTVPFIEGWIEQMYGNVPACVKVCDPVLPLLIVPVSQLPFLAVAVWGAMS
jgi:hypothetical protein